MGITVVAADEPDTGLRRAREDIEASGRGNGRSVLVLGRYKSSEYALKSKTPWRYRPHLTPGPSRLLDFIAASP